MILDKHLARLIIFISAFISLYFMYELVDYNPILISFRVMFFCVRLTY